MTSCFDDVVRWDIPIAPRLSVSPLKTLQKFVGRLDPVVTRARREAELALTA